MGPVKYANDGYSEHEAPFVQRRNILLQRSVNRGQESLDMALLSA